MKNPNILEKRIAKIKSDLLAIDEMHPGKDPKNPQKHGPYYQLSYVSKGKSTSRFIKAEFLQAVKKQTANYAKFKALSEDWKNLAADLVKLKMNLAVAKRKN